MERLTLLERARTAGLSVRADGNTLIIRGPRRAEALARELFEHKAKVLEQLRGSPGPESVTGDLLAWASELAEQAMELDSPVEYTEAPLRTVTITRVSFYAARYLRVILEARHHRQHPELCWKPFLPDWWKERGEEAMGALMALKTALEDRANHDA